MLIPTAICRVLVVDACPECGAQDCMHIDWTLHSDSYEGQVFCVDCGHEYHAAEGSDAFISPRERSERRGLSLFKQVDHA